MIQSPVNNRKIVVFFVIFLAGLPALEVSINLTLWKFHGCKMTENGQKHWSNCKDSTYIERYSMGVSLPSRVIRHYFSNKYARFSAQEQYMGSGGYVSAVKNRIFFKELCQCLGHFSVILQPWHFCKVEFTYISCASKTARKITKNSSIFRLLTRIWIIHICEVPLVLWIFKSGNFFWLTR